MCGGAGGEMEMEMEMGGFEGLVGGKGDREGGAGLRD